MERSPELQELIRAWFDAFSRGDGEWIRRHLSRADEVRMIGTDPANWYGGARVGEFLGGAVDELGGTVEIRPVEVLAVQEGSIGWGVMRGAIRPADGSEIAFRWSVVFRDELDGWRAVQIHGSIGVPDEDAFGAEP